MSYYEIQGGRPLGGALAVHGAKNSAAPGVGQLRRPQPGQQRPQED